MPYDSYAIYLLLLYIWSLVTLKPFGSFDYKDTYNKSTKLPTFFHSKDMIKKLRAKTVTLQISKERKLLKLAKYIFYVLTDSP